MALKLGWTTGSGLGRKKQGIISSFLHHSNSAAFIILMVHHSVQTGHSWHSCVVDFALGLVNPVLNLPEGLVKFLGKFKLQKNCNQCCPSKICLGYLKDSWASIYEQQLARMASRKTDLLCTLYHVSLIGKYEWKFWPNTHYRTASRGLSMFLWRS